MPTRGSAGAGGEESRQTSPAKPRDARRRTTEDLSDGSWPCSACWRAISTSVEIGEALFVSFNTVKTHVKSIFRKLDVDTRPDAVLRARELNLL